MFRALSVSFSSTTQASAQIGCSWSRSLESSSVRQLPSLSDLLNFTMDPSLSQSSSCSLSSLPRGAGGLLPRLLRRVSGKGERVRRGLEVITCAVGGHRRSKVNNRGKFVCGQRQRLRSSNHRHQGGCRPCRGSELENPKLREGGSIEVACKRDRRNGGGRRVRGREPRVSEAGVSGEESLEKQWNKRLRYVMLGMRSRKVGGTNSNCTFRFRTMRVGAYHMRSLRKSSRRLRSQLR